MRLELLGAAGADPLDTDRRRDIGAVVARAVPVGGLVLELGPADGSAHLRLVMTNPEALRLAATLHAVATGREEEIVITETK